MTTDKQLQLFGLYTQMAHEGVDRGQVDGAPKDFSLMNIRLFKEMVAPLFLANDIKSVLDYGCGNTSWDMPGFSDERSAKEYFAIESVWSYEPSLGLDERQQADAVVCFDVLEHVFLADVSSVVWDLFSYAKKLLVVNVACYPAGALLPNGENAHITVRPPLWWKGVFDAVAPAFPDVVVCLYASTEYARAEVFSPASPAEWLAAPGFTRPLV
ncbi:hypothetical protein KBY97_08335 [Synechococcus sp. ATX 2A4]|uniref:class I SAM-dependent methyltransferase n=1 Tax=Synechococcus sp. ATX 2A4 TaxID=2823727 RepID=UPI0020CF7537|nr:class I SAM-dependent methyltransferase [Synechococcus sp. ATX 2A4]MCP9885132.1 hypothetical protein [Synechococcus sp. ATX 2A4]